MRRSGAAPTRWRPLQLTGDLAAAVLAFYAAFQLRIHLPIAFTRFLLPPERIRFFFEEWWVVAASQLLVLYFFGFYDPPERVTGAEGSRRLATAVSLQGLALAGFYFLTDAEFPRSVLLIFVGFNLLLLAAWRALLRRLFRPPRRRVALVGCGTAARELAMKIQRQRVLGLELIGYVPAPDEPAPDEAAPDETTAEETTGQGSAAALGRCLGTVDDLPELLAAREIDDIILATNSRPWQTRLLDRLSNQRTVGSNVLLLPGPVESLIGRMRYRWVEDVPLIEVVGQSEWRIDRPVKRLVDLLGAALLLLPALPLMTLCGAAVRLTSPGPALYRQTRIGRQGKRFQLVKLRTMHTDAERDTGETLATPDDPRLTPVGALLRRFRLDELPQLFNVLAGSMSLVGPRPERPGFVQRYLDQVPGYAERFAVLPGLTGLAQINGDYLSSAENKLRYDLAYIANWSPWLDLSILVRTVKIVLTSRGI